MNIWKHVYQADGTNFEGDKKKPKFTWRARLCIVCHAEPSAVLMSINDFILYILISIFRNIVVYGQTLL